jgi:hypothetical protein
MCALCDHGYCPRHDSDRARLDLNPYYADPGELELERREKALSTVDFKEAATA